MRTRGYSAAGTACSRGSSGSHTESNLAAQTPYTRGPCTRTWARSSEATETAEIRLGLNFAGKMNVLRTTCTCARTATRSARPCHSRPAKCWPQSGITTKRCRSVEKHREDCEQRYLLLTLADSVYLSTLRTTLMATIRLRFLSTHSRTRPKVPTPASRRILYRDKM